MRILMLGNSLSTAHGLPDRLGELLGAEVTVHARGGARLAEQLNPATRLGALTGAALDAGGWDYVVMQEVSNAAVRSPGRMIESVSSLSARAREVGAEPVLYGTWAYAPWCLKLELLGCTSAEMRAAMDVSHHEACAISGAVLADVGGAFWDHPDPASLYVRDGIHPSGAGADLAARVLARAMGGTP
ncbi:MAG: SGNH/GDSL hydrolase family protein [Atopobiaceae bacterium]|nr:SGNH/GDSL hydrolase family protein [Atopobiaceae bacterium]